MYIRELHFRERVHQQRGLGGIGEEVSEPFTEYYYYYYLFFLFHSFHPCFFFPSEKGFDGPSSGPSQGGSVNSLADPRLPGILPVLFYSIRLVLFRL